MEPKTNRNKHMLLCALILFAGPARAETLQCRTTEAWRLETSGMVAHSKDFYGLAQTSDLRVDIDQGNIRVGVDPNPGLTLRSRPNAETGADLVYSTDDGAMLFRARYLDGATPFLLIDAYDVYTGTCER